MIFCKRCGYEGIYTGKQCPNCNSTIELAESDLAEIKEELLEAKKNGEFETTVENYRILADFGSTEAQREYAKMLESGRLVPRDLDTAAEYFLMAAEKQDAIAAFRYSRLISRMNDDVGSFWLCYAALLDLPEAYLPAAEDYERRGQNDTANYYYLRAVSCDDVDAIVTVAQKYYTGKGLPMAPEYAKWYMDKLTFPPLHAVRLAIRLRSFSAKEPPAIPPLDYEGTVRRLYGIAKRFGYKGASLHLAEILSDRGDRVAAVELGKMLLEGEESRPEEAIRALTRAASAGSSEGYALLGKIHLDGKITEQNIRFGLDCLKKSAELGNGEAYDILGDFYHSPECPDRNVALAFELYELAANNGIADAREKAKAIADARNAYYEKGKAEMRMAPKESYKHLAIATMMGCIPAAVELATCYQYGIGTKKSRTDAFYWYKKAAEADYPEAPCPLGVCYAEGMGTAFDFDLAIDCFKKADTYGIPGAKARLTRLYDRKKKCAVGKMYSTGMRLVYQKKFNAAAQYLALAARFGHPKATYALGTLYEFGRGVEASKPTAQSLYEKAAQGFFIDTNSRFKQIILRMMKRIG